MFNGLCLPFRAQRTTTGKPNGPTGRRLKAYFSDRPLPAWCPCCTIKSDTGASIALSRWLCDVCTGIACVLTAAPVAPALIINVSINGRLKLLLDSGGGFICVAATWRLKLIAVICGGLFPADTSKYSWYSHKTAVPTGQRSQRLYFLNGLTARPQGGGIRALVD